MPAAVRQRQTISSDGFAFNALLDTKSVTRSRVQIVLERVQSINARSINYNYKRMFASLHKDILDMGAVPDALDLAAAVYRYDSLQSRILQDAYDRIAAQVLPLVTDSGMLKSESDRLYYKADAEAESDKVNTELYKLRIMDYIQSQTGIHITRIDTTTLKDIQRIMAETSNTQEFQDRINIYFSADAPNRAYTIARTESHNAAQTAASESVKMTQSGRHKSKTWRTSIIHVRPSHAAVAGVTIDMDDLFSVANTAGGVDYMEYPGDSSHGAGAGNIVNCNCYLTYAYTD